MATKFINEKRKCGSTTEGFGPDQFTWYDYEVKCPCGCWTKSYGDVSQQVDNDPNVHQWLCPKCVAESEAEYAKEVTLGLHH